MKIEQNGAIALVRLEGGKANAMTRELLAHLGQLVDEAARSAGAIVITGYDRFFSGGLALPSLVDLDRAALREFIDFFGEIMLKVFTCPRPVVAAVNGHAIAGGCVLALQCDVRLMWQGKIGLNEVQLGIGLPSSVIEPLRFAVPPSAYARLALEGALVDAQEAKAIGLVDELTGDDLIQRAFVRAERLQAAAPLAFAQTKAALRRPAVDAMRAHAADERERWLDTWFSDEGQRRLRAAVAQITRQ